MTVLGLRFPLNLYYWALNNLKYDKKHKHGEKEVKRDKIKYCCGFVFFSYSKTHSS